MTIHFKLKAFPKVSETFIVNNLVYAKQKGFDIRIITDRYLGLENSSQIDILKKYNIESDIVKPFSFSNNKFKKLFQFLYILSNFRILKSVYAFYMLKRKKNLSPLATLYQYRNLRNGIVHVHFNNALQPLIDLAKIGYINPQCIITFHGYDAYLDSKEIFQKKYAEFYKKHVKYITINSEHLTKRAIKLGVESSLIKIVPIGINSNLFTSFHKNILDKPVVELISVGRLIQWKGHIYGIKAVKKLIDRNCKVNYTIIGKGDLDSDLKQEIKEFNLEKFIHIEGAKSQNEIAKYLKSSHISILPSTYDNKVLRRETFGLVSVEAQAMGLPVIGFKSGGFPETIIEGETGFAVEDRNVEQLATKIEYLIRQPNIYSKMSKAAIKHAQKFAHHKTTQQYLDLYHKFNA